MTVIKIRYRQVYMEVPNDDIEAIDVVLKVLRFFKKRLNKRREKKK